MKHYLLGTDWWDDCDDVVALRILARAHKAGRIDLKAVAINVCKEDSVSSLDGFLQLEEIENIPIGIDRNATDFEGRPTYQNYLKQFATRYRSNDEAEDGVRLYRRIMAESQETIEIVEIGYLQILSNVLESPPDDISEKSGLELVKEKVSKIWIMGGKWDEDGGVENNLARNARAKAAAEAVCRLCPVSITFLGFEVGADVISGDNLNQDDFLHLAMCEHGSGNGRNSWDPMLVALAITGSEAQAGYETIKGTAMVEPLTGANYFKPSEKGRHQFVVRKYAPEYYQETINLLIKSE